jgi:hypothetical protein
MERGAQVSKPKDFPIAEISASCEKLIAAGGFIQQVWTCDGCARRISANSLNTITHHGSCQHCHTITNLDERGCNFRAIITSAPGMTVAQMEAQLGISKDAGFH